MSQIVRTVNGTETAQQDGPGTASSSTSAKCPRTKLPRTKLTERVFSYMKGVESGISSPFHSESSYRLKRNCTNLWKRNLSAISDSTDTTTSGCSCTEHTWRWGKDQRKLSKYGCPVLMVYPRNLLLNSVGGKTSACRFSYLRNLKLKKNPLIQSFPCSYLSSDYKP